MKDYFKNIATAVFQPGKVKKSVGRVRIQEQVDEQERDDLLLDLRGYAFGNNNSGIFVGTNQLTWTATDSGTTTEDNSPTYAVSSNSQRIVVNNETKEKRVLVKPKDVIDELERVPTNYDLIAIDEKIKVIKKKQELVQQKYARRDLNHLLLCLESRKKATNEDWKFFKQFDATSQDKVEALVKKYDLKFAEADLFVPEFPDVAVEIMSEYKERTKNLTDKNPRFFVIATSDNFKKIEDKRDPILLASSPFGFYYYILGAWDEEMLYLPEL